MKVVALLRHAETNMQTPELIEKWAQEKRGWREPMLKRIERARMIEVITSAQSSKRTPAQRKERAIHYKAEYYYKNRRQYGR